MTTEHTDRARRADPDDRGFALVIVIGVLSILTILAASAMVLSQQTLADVQRADRTEKAFQAANAGLDAALARVGSVPLANLNGTWPWTVGVGGASYTVALVPAYSATVNTYTVTAVGVYGSAVQTVTAQIAGTVSSQSSYGGFVFGAGYIGANGQSTTNFWGPISTEGDFTVKNVNGVPNDPNLGFSTHAFENAIRVHSGHVYTSSGTRNTYPQKLYANMWETASTADNKNFGDFSALCATVTMPDFVIADLQAAYDRAVFKIPQGVPRPSTMTPETAPFDWTIPQPLVTNENGSFSWQPSLTGSGKKAVLTGLLTLNGILYVDGPIDIPDLYYTGRGTIVVRGNVTCKTVLPYRGKDTMNNPPRYSPLSSGENLGIVTAGNITSTDPNDDPSVSPGNNKSYMGDFGLAGTFYAGGLFKMTGGNNQRIKGSVICSQFWGDGNNIHYVVDPDIPYFLPPNMPDGGAVATGIFARVPGTWARE